MVKLLTIIRDLEKIMIQEGYGAPTSIGLNLKDAEILRVELQDFLRYQSANAGERCWFHNIEIIAPSGFDWNIGEVG